MSKWPVQCLELPPPGRARRLALYDFVRKHPKGQRVILNYTFGVGDILDWLEQHDPQYTLLLNYGWDWPLGLSSRQTLLHMHLLFYEPGRW